MFLPRTTSTQGCNYLFNLSLLCNTGTAYLGDEITIVDRLSFSFEGINCLLIRNLSRWLCSSRVQHLLKVATLYVFRSKQDLPKGVYIVVIAPKRTNQKKKKDSW